MLARIFLWFIALATLLVVAGSFAFFQFGDRILADQAMPKVEFVAPPEAEEPTYASADAWWARPDLPDSLADWQPDPYQGAAQIEVAADTAAGAEGPATAGEGPAPERPVAVFFIHPTTYLQTDRWNADMQLEGMARTRAELFVKSQASAFNNIGEVWAPRYRQATFGTFLSQSDNAQAALDVAYGDVREAFGVFLEANPSRPVVIAGHSQGALHALRLLTDHRDALGERLVAAYVVGWPVDAAADLPATGLDACSGPAQARCLMSWLTFGDPPNASLVLRDWLKADGYAGLRRDRDRLVCTNPLTGGEDREAVPADNPGLLVPDAKLTTAQLLPGSVGARCDRGLLLLNGTVPALGPYVLPGNNYHVFDYALFWGAVRADLEQRYAAWAAAAPGAGA
ncbi:DUF3089 domain-containing protein [Sphingomicrobium astaxanthinifaciens]|uniref:DUF3089 domain-containing protein n=1 Tax=Sphingomicrobium astaxanthinifaciens TaxID=1227949 RepID=UPI001FCB90EC|nr:DUF3089 domain-containing protein [Sphingomicrobium astaxanthinifaciens]MCJ7420276.1 DUF3089 domain-containing protein [Sphingomicrobium astaxanthinifaciens]